MLDITKSFLFLFLALRLARLRLGWEIKPVPDFFVPESEMQGEFLELKAGNGYVT